MWQSRRSSFIGMLATFGLWVAAPTFAVPDAASIDAILARAADAFDSPGMAVSVVHKDELVYANGYGILEVGGDAPVDADTLFHIGSVSNAFTAAALAILADEGELGFDDRVINHLPEFRMHDA